MVSIGICGASGCGKSLLVKQLSAINCAPCILEGEVGTYPKKVILEIKNQNNPVYLFKWFVSKYKKQFILAKKLSNSGFLCFVDGCNASIPAHKVAEKKEFHKLIEKTYSGVKEDVDIIVLLTQSNSNFKKMINLRGRAHEQSKEYMERSLKIQDEFIRLLSGKKNVLIINRDKYDFTKYDDIVKINKIILNFSKKY